MSSSTFQLKEFIMSIEWAGYAPPLSSDMSQRIVDNTLSPSSMLNQAPFTVIVRWDVPLPAAMGINALHQFRLRLYAESIGPRPDRVLVNPAAVNTFLVPGVVNQTAYTTSLLIDPVGSGIFAEGAAVPGGPDVNNVDSSGMYKIVCVLQHLNAGVLTGDSGCTDESTVMFRTP
jgi:hypothetical protein